ncbi:hypothetical protein AGLY_016869 [Aphis glycines]|uniref:FLYWCH-type domain-containing protein n=1 Tax=Aphis glycines TaxID=307491 RepID=A0A6G0SWJ1_APHGL|nr:hypothetical protein AGLY_016869 [Aphis glycines]
MSLNYLESSKAKDLLVYLGCIFEKNYLKKEKTYWKCIRYNTDKSRGRTHTKNSEVTFHNDDHNHTPNAEEIGVKKCISQIKEMSNQSESTPQQIIAQMSCSSTAVSAAALPTINSMEKMIQRIRHRKNAPPANPAVLSELIIFESYNITLDYEQFLLYDSGVDDNNRILLFSTKNNLKILASEQSHWFIDGIV